MSPNIYTQLLISVSRRGGLTNVGAEIGAERKCVGRIFYQEKCIYV